MNTLVFAVAARIYILPRITNIDPKVVLIPILLLNATRHLGLMFISPGATDPGIPSQFAYPAAFGDLAASTLAFIALALVISDHPAARTALWALTIEGTLDLLTAVATGTVYNAAAYMGPTYWIPATIVPLLLVSHYVTFMTLTRTDYGRAPTHAGLRQVA